MNLATAKPGIYLSQSHIWTLCLTLFMFSYSVAMVPPIMPLLVRELNTSIGYVQGALVLFSLVTASFAPTCENLCQFYGRSPIFRIGLWVYGIGILSAAISPDISLWVISFALITGLAATPLVSMPWTLIDSAYEGKQEQQAMLILTLCSTMGALTGAIGGGWIAAQLGWRWAVSPALGIWLVVLLLGRSLPETTIPRQQPIDWIGGLISFLGFGSILLGISLAGEFGWWAPKRVFAIAGVIIPPFALSIVPTLISVGVICLGLFVAWQRQQNRRSSASLLRVGLLRKPIFVCGLLTSMMHGLVTTGVQFNLDQLLPTVLKLNPVETAIAVLPYNVTLIIAIVALLKYLTLHQQFPPKYIVYFGLMVLLSGLMALYGVTTPTMDSLQLLPPLVIMGIGSGCFLAYIGGLAYSVATRAEKPEGTGIYRPAQQLGSSLGRGVLGTILIAFTSTQIVDRLQVELGTTLSGEQRRTAIAALQRLIQTYPKDERNTLLQQAVPDQVRPQLQAIAESAAISGMRTALLVAMALIILCMLLAIALPKSVRTTAQINEDII